MGSERGDGDVAAINIYSISDYINRLDGYAINPYDDADLLTWAASIAYPRRDRMKNELRKQLNPEFVDYAIDSVVEAYYVFRVEEFINSYDWIASKRSDDGLWRIITEFFTDRIDIEGLRTVYEECSFGNQLVLKKQAASDCVILSSCETYPKSEFFREYEQSLNRRTSFFNAWQKQHENDDNALRCHDILWNEAEYQKEDFF